MLRVLVFLTAISIAADAFGQEPSVSIDVDVFSAPDGVFNLCWMKPRRSSKRDLRRLEKALTFAARDTQPPHVNGKLLRIRNRRKDEPQKNCRAVVDVTAKGPRKRRTFEFDVYLAGEKTTVLEQTAGPVHAGRVTTETFLPVFAKTWKAIAPEPEPEPVASVPYRDEEIAAERVLLAPVFEVGPPPDPRPTVSAEVLSGVVVRGIRAPGAADAQLFSVGAAVALHAAPLLRIERQSLDLRVAYLRHFATAARGGERYDVAADRLELDACWHYVFEHPYWPRVGARAGWEQLRFEVDDAASALSVRYGVVRAGASVQQALYSSEPFELSLAVAGDARITPGSGHVAVLGWDAGARLAARWRFGLYVALDGRVLEQRGSLDGAEDFTDRFVDGALAVGWSL